MSEVKSGENGARWAGGGYDGYDGYDIMGFMRRFQLWDKTWERSFGVWGGFRDLYFSFFFFFLLYLWWEEVRLMGSASTAFE